MFFKKTGFEAGATFLREFKTFENYLDFIKTNNTNNNKEKSVVKLIALTVSIIDLLNFSFIFLLLYHDRMFFVLFIITYPYCSSVMFCNFFYFRFWISVFIIELSYLIFFFQFKHLFFHPLNIFLFKDSGFFVILQVAILGIFYLQYCVFLLATLGTFSLP